MKATRHNGRSGKHGTYDAKHNDRRFDVENSEHIDAERTKMNVYWDCYQRYSLQNDKDEQARFTFTEIEMLRNIQTMWTVRMRETGKQDTMTE